MRLFANGEVLEIQVVPSDEVKISPHKSIYYARMGIILGGLPDCEEIVGQLPSLSLIPQFSTLLYKNWKFYLEGV